MAKAEPKNIYESGDKLKDDTDFLHYFITHSKTERALFHASHVLYMLQLAGTDISNLQWDDRVFASCYYDEWDAVIEKARANILERAKKTDT